MILKPHSNRDETGKSILGIAAVKLEVMWLPNSKDKGIVHVLVAELAPYRDHGVTLGGGTVSDFILGGAQDTFLY